MRLRNTGGRPGREVVQVYLATPEGDNVERPAQRLAGFASVEAAPGQTAEATIVLPRRAAEVWGQQVNGWCLIPGRYTAEVGRSLDDLRVRTDVEVAG